MKFYWFTWAHADLILWSPNIFKVFYVGLDKGEAEKLLGLVHNN